MRQWTQEERAKQSEKIRQWQPWTKSTGARTPEGKARSSGNAFKGGWRQELRDMCKLLREQRDNRGKFRGNYLPRLRVSTMVTNCYLLPNARTLQVVL